MSSVAEEARRQAREEVLRLSPADRLALALQLGDADLELFQQAQGLDRETALRRLRAQRQAGRRPSACLAENR
jgi:hypothetical protein